VNNFNLLISTSRFNETNATAELWFTLLISGDKYPIISTLKFPGLIIALSNYNPKEAILKFKEILFKDSDYFQYILKIVPIDYVCEPNVKTISLLIQNHYREYINKNETFRISLKRRKHENIDRNRLITMVAKKIDNKVDLENPDKIVRIEILGNLCGISFLKQDDILNYHKLKQMDS